MTRTTYKGKKVYLGLTVSKDEFMTIVAAGRQTDMALEQ